MIAIHDIKPPTQRCLRKVATYTATNQTMQSNHNQNHMILPVYLDLLQHKKDYDDKEVISYKSTVALQLCDGDKELNSDT